MEGASHRTTWFDSSLLQPKFDAHLQRSEMVAGAHSHYTHNTLFYNALMCSVIRSYRQSYRQTFATLGVGRVYASPLEGFHQGGAA